MPTDYFGPEVAPTYDEAVREMFDAPLVEQTVDFLAGLAGDGPVLELGIGTGRVALPLAARGLRVHGIDLSEAMVGELRAKPGGEEIDVTLGDLATTRVDGTFRLAYLVFNTILNVTSQDEQVACFQNVAASLEPGGCFVIETGIPQLRKLPAGERFVPFSVTPTHLGIDEYDVAEQGLVSHHHTLPDGTWKLRSIPFRYVWPAELDLMARLAGMTLRERWADWTREPSTSESRKHISVWQRS